MTRNPLYPALYLAGLGVTGWIGAGYLVSNPVGAIATLLIAACYVAGGIELRRYRQVTATLAAALDEVPAAGTGLGEWLARLHPGLRNAVRLRIEGERVPLPAPALTPYLVGLLVLLGMLGTLVGMMATLRGTGLALEGATDLDAIRGSLAAPIKGLAFAFGTSMPPPKPVIPRAPAARLCNSQPAVTRSVLALRNSLPATWISTWPACSRPRPRSTASLSKRAASSRPFRKRHGWSKAWPAIQ